MQGSWKAVEGSTDHVIRLTMFRGLDAGRLESRASASSLTDRQCIVLSSGRLACFAGPWVCLKEAPQPSSHVASLLLPSRSPPSPTALFTHGAFTDTFTLPRHIAYRAPIQDASAAAFLSAHRPEHTTPLPTATSFISAISTSTATPASSLYRTALQHTNTATMMRRSDSISSISSMGSDADETMHIFVKNVSGTSSKLHTRYPGFRASEPPRPDLRVPTA